jgi:predicted lipid-binding transport protein (Tim44 family)
LTPHLCVGLADVSGWLGSLFGILGEGLLGLPITGRSLLQIAALGLMAWLIGVVAMRRSRLPARAMRSGHTTGP